MSGTLLRIAGLTACQLQVLALLPNREHHCELRYKKELCDITTTTRSKATNSIRVIQYLFDVVALAGGMKYVRNGTVDLRQVDEGNKERTSWALMVTIPLDGSRVCEKHFANVVYTLDSIGTIAKSRLVEIYLLVIGDHAAVFRCDSTARGVKITALRTAMFFVHIPGTIEGIGKLVDSKDELKRDAVWRLATTKFGWQVRLAGSAGRFGWQVRLAGLGSIGPGGPAALPTWEAGKEEPPPRPKTNTI
ncbi:hypothetical protein CFD26_103636 [Aspergillus turcosus]|uniref:Uncharacterized protein n=1 Tax=Aspergillus turcosus TaxID=1245748 RepID=A0A421D263_9EURO|nr:hypothetical protein CFD26_103636 [Aspergillus turcosus]